ncbi:MAG: GNAT family N-acetyltransferase, partial [Actinobacteria bacterium]|nr:GNAT family N-acetyltransferase [Actinomycetota bacterium]
AMLLGLMHKFALDGSWGLLAFSGGDAAGQVTARPELDVDGELVPGAARLTQLFVLERHWGSGLAKELHDLIVDGMRERGFTKGCLWAAAGQARARAFYEREGWRTSGRLDADNELGLELVEYELEL